MKYWIPIIVVFIGWNSLGWVGCTAPRLSEPSRTAVEQLLLSTAVDHSLEAVRLPEVHGRKVFVDPAHLDGYDKAYTLGSIRALLSENGAHLVGKIDEADMVVEPRSGALGIDSTSTLLGIPAIPIPVPGAGTLQTPELAAFKSQKANSTSKLALLAYNRTTGAPEFSTDSLVGKSRHYHYSILGFINFERTDIPEKKSHFFKKKP